MSKKHILLSHKKNVLDLLSEAEMLRYRSIDCLMNVNTKLLPVQGELLEYAERYRRLVKKSNYLTAIRSDITFAVSVVSQFLSAPRTIHLGTIIRILRYLKNALVRGLLYSDHRHTRVVGFSDVDWA